MNQFKPLSRKCKSCKGDYMTNRPMQSVCSPKCALSAAKVQREKTERKEIRAAKAAIKPRSKYLAEAQQSFNAFIRERDMGLPCISCGRNDGEVVSQSVGGTWDCGHYRSVGAAPELRFEPLNAARQCKRCNRDMSGRVVDYRINLIKRIGADQVDWIEGKHQPKKYSIEDLQSIKAHYRDMTRALKLKGVAA
jgi:hypothetical protein